MPKHYLGDGVFVDFDGYYIVLTTSDGVRDTNTIYLEPPVCESFVSWNKDMMAAVQSAESEPAPPQEIEP